MTNNKDFQFTQPAPRVQVHLPDGRTLSGPRGASIREFLQPLAEENGYQIVGAVVNGQLRELTRTIQTESDVQPVRMNTADGMRIYRRSLTLLLEAAFGDLYPEAQINVDHSVSFGGYYCQIKGRETLTDGQLAELKAYMRQMVADDIPIRKQNTPLDEAIAYFEAHNHQDKVRLLKHRKKDYMVLYFINEHGDYHQGYMVPSTGYLKWFDLEPIEGGFTLRFPRRHAPEEILPLGEYPKLLDTFRRYGSWLELLGIESVGALNDAIEAGRIREVMLVSEALHEQRIADLASQIAARHETNRLVLIAGPSSSGKTTTSRRLSIQLLAHGIQPFPLELDNYFVAREDTPKDENGEYDYEHINAIDLKRFNRDLKKLISNQEVTMPKYDFLSGKRKHGETVQLRPEQVIIIEGIHGLNPQLVQGVSDDQVFRIYISALTQLNLDRHNRVSTTDTRLIRRIVRDARMRGYSAQETIRRWESVRRGEKRYIFPYQENADVMFNSALVYELATLKPLAEPLLRQVTFGTPEHIEVKRLLALLEWFLPVESDYIPDNSLLREFIGGSILKDFKLWRNG